MIESTRRTVLGMGAAIGVAVAGDATSAKPCQTEEPRSMFAVAFEVQPHPETKAAYLDTAKLLRPLLEQVEGFCEVDRFESPRRPGWLLSLSFWEDEAALTRWRSHECHHAAQLDGRNRIFADYRIRVAQVIADDSFRGKVLRPKRRTAYRAASLRSPRLLSMTESVDDGSFIRSLHSPRGEIFNSIYHAGKVVLVDEHKDEIEAEAWRRLLHHHGASDVEGSRVRVMEVERDYGLKGRGEAPQYMPAV